MNLTDDKGRWIDQKDKLKQKIFVLTGNEMIFEEGKKDEVLERLQVKLGKSKEEVIRIIDSL